MAQTVIPLGTGDHAPAFSLPATDGRTYSLASTRDSPFLVIIFLARNCRYVAAWDDRIIDIVRDFSSRGVSFLGVDARVAVPSSPDSSQQNSQSGSEKNYPFPYLHDADQSVARSFGATHTPEVFVFDQERLLRYHGAVDSDWQESAYLNSYLRQALDRLVTGQSVYLPHTPPLGCEIDYPE